MSEARRVNITPINIIVLFLQTFTGLLLLAHMLKLSLLFHLSCFLVVFLSTRHVYNGMGQVMDGKGGLHLHRGSSFLVTCSFVLLHGPDGITDLWLPGWD